MKKKAPRQTPPTVARNYRELISEESLALWSFLKSNWYYVIPLLLLIITVIYIVRPVPPSKIRLATGQPNSTFQVIGEDYREIFRKHGVELELVQTMGALENNQLLNRGEVDAIFSQGGMKIHDPGEKIQSLGSIAYQPLWLFYRGREVAASQHLHEFLQERQVSINVVGSGTRILAENILKLHHVDPESSNFHALTTRDSISALLSGKLDAMFLVAGVESNNLRELLFSPGMHIFNFHLSDAYTKRLRYLESVTVPRGSIEFNPISPITDVNLISTTVTILTTEDLHPALQLLFLEAAEDFDARRSVIFNRETRFPAYSDTNVPESDVARRFYKEGSPFLWGYVPYWLASLFDEIWFYLLAAGAVIIPLLGSIPSYRKTHAELSMEECYSQLRVIELNVLEAQDRDSLNELLAELDALKHRVWRLWVPSGNRPAFYDLKNAVLMVRNEIVHLLETT